MERFFVEEFLLRNEDYLLLNDETQENLTEALCQIPDEYKQQLENFPFKDPKKAKLIATFFGKRAVEWFYLEDTKDGFLKKYFSAYKISFKRKKKKDVNKLCREYNNHLLLNIANDPSIAQKIREKNEKLKIGAKLGLELGKELAKGGKEIQKGFYVDDD